MHEGGIVDRSAGKERGVIVWLTGPPASGKTTIANALAAYLTSIGRRAEILDGDVVRRELSRDLGFSREDRAENVRRVGYVCQLLARNGVVAIAALVSPYREDRDAVRDRTPDFVEVFLDCSRDVLEQRDPKGLYAKARRGEVSDLTGVSAPYEAPLHPDLTLATESETVSQSVGRLAALLRDRGYLAPSEIS